MLSTKLKKKNFSSFTLKEAMKQLDLSDLLQWRVEITSQSPSKFFQQRLERLECFDLQTVEESKKLLIDAICEEAIQPFKRLKIWKSANLESTFANGYADYLVAERKRYLEAPMLCVVEAKKDDFEQGLAQCLVEMQACQMINFKLNHQIDIFGIVTNAEGWKFYKLGVDGKTYESDLHGFGELSVVLGWLNYIFQSCEYNLS